MVNGRKATVSNDPAGLKIVFPQAVTLLPSHEIAHTVMGGSRVGICLVLPTVVVPGTVNPVTSFLVAPRAGARDWPDAMLLCSGLPNAIDHSSTDELCTACGRTQVQLVDALPVCVWTSRTCTVVQDVKAVVLQRTQGGMSTYDAHIIPNCGDVLSIDLLPHSSLTFWADKYGPASVVDAGPDPVAPRRVREAQLYPDVREYILGDPSRGMLSDEEEEDETSDWCDEGTSSDESICESTESMSDQGAPVSHDSSDPCDTSSGDSESSLDLTDTSE